MTRAEPAYLLDASVWSAAVAPGDPRQGEAERLLVSERSVFALDLTLYEVANAVGVKMGLARRAEQLLALVAVRCAKVFAVDQAALGAALGVAAEQGLTAYDGAYVAAARRHDLTLVSLDLRDLVSKGLAVTPDAAV